MHLLFSIEAIVPPLESSGTGVIRLSSETKSIKSRIIGRLYDDLLKHHGFLRSGLSLSKHENAIEWRVGIELDSLQRSGHVSLTAIVGAHVNGFSEVMGSSPDPARVDACAVWARVGILASGMTTDHDIWWTYPHNEWALSRADTVAGEMLDLLERDGLPFLRQLDSIESIIAFLIASEGQPIWPCISDRQNRATIAVLLALNGNRESGLRAVDEMIRSTHTSAIRDVLLDLRQRINEFSANSGSVADGIL